MFWCTFIRPKGHFKFKCINWMYSFYLVWLFLSCLVSHLSWSCMKGAIQRKLFWMNNACCWCSICVILLSISQCASKVLVLLNHHKCWRLHCFHLTHKGHAQRVRLYFITWKRVDASLSHIFICCSLSLQCAGQVLRFVFKSQWLRTGLKFLQNLSIFHNVVFVCVYNSYAYKVSLISVTETQTCNSCIEPQH